MLILPPGGVLHYIVLTQPWATLMAIGAKLVETRSWATKYRGALAISAARGFPRECQDLFFTAPFEDVLRDAGYERPADLPRGQVIAVTEVYDCQPTALISPKLTWREQQFGDYSDCRYGFMTRGVRRVREPVPLRGLQRIQKLPLPIFEGALV